MVVVGFWRRFQVVLFSELALNRRQEFRLHRSDCVAFLYFYRFHAISVSVVSDRDVPHVVGVFGVKISVPFFKLLFQALERGLVCCWLDPHT